MKQNRLAIMAIPVLAAVLIGGSIAPVAYADHQNNAECIAIITQFLDALADNNFKKVNAMIKAFENACLSTNVLGAECDAFEENFFRALDRGDADAAIKQLENFLLVCL